MPHDSTDTSDVPTTRSVLPFATSKSEGPRKYSNAINYYEAEILFQYCRIEEQLNDVLTQEEGLRIID